jgi:hypothetical protein
MACLYSREARRARRRDYRRRKATGPLDGSDAFITSRFGRDVATSTARFGSLDQTSQPLCVRPRFRNRLVEAAFALAAVCWTQLRS